MPSTVAVARNLVSSSIVSKVFRLFVHGRDEVLVIFDVDVDDVVVSIGARGVEVPFQRSVRAVARHGEKHVIDAIRTEGFQADFVTKASAQLVVVRVVALQQAVGDEQQRVGRNHDRYRG